MPAAPVTTNQLQSKGRRGAGRERLVEGLVEGRVGIGRAVSGGIVAGGRRFVEVRLVRQVPGSTGGAAQPSTAVGAVDLDGPAGKGAFLRATGPLGQRRCDPAAALRADVPARFRPIPPPQRRFRPPPEPPRTPST